MIFNQLLKRHWLCLLLTFCMAPLADPAIQSSQAMASACLNNAVAATVVCPFCSAVNRTFTEQLGSNEVAVVAKLVELPPPPKEDEDGYLEFSKGKFEIVGVLKGNKIVESGMTFRTQLIGTYKVGEKFLVMGTNPPKIAWTTPMRTSDRVFKYLQDIQKLPPTGPERLVFFQEYFEDEESVLAFDAYDEFARSPYEDLIAMKDQMDRPRLVGYIKNTKTTVLRRRLYLTMLGVCGTAEDADLLETFIKSGDRKKQAGLDALLACYLRLKGADGLPLVEKTFLKDKSVDYVDVVSVVMALRFHATECDVIPQKKIVASIRTLLDRPRMADMIITDLARWKDWSVMERLVKMFKESETDNAWVRVPIITYLRACPDPKAAKYIEELRKIDAEAVKRADFYIGYGDDEGDSWDDDESEETPATSSGDKKTSPKPDTPKPEAPKSGADGDSSNSTESSRIPGPAPTEGEQVEQDLVNLNVEMPLESKRVTLAQGDPVLIESPTSDVATVPVRDSVAPTAYQVSIPSPQASPVAFGVGENGNGEGTSATTEANVASLTASSQTPSTSEPANHTTKILLYPFLGSLLIWGVMWSVFNGWFERLIY